MSFEQFVGLIGIICLIICGVGFQNSDLVIKEITASNKRRGLKTDPSLIKHAVRYKKNLSIFLFILAGIVFVTIFII